MTGIQFYFYDPLHQASNRMNTFPRLDMSIMKREPTTDRHALKLQVWLENESDSGDQSELWDIMVYTKSGRNHKVQYYYGCYDLLQYVLVFPNGEPGWHNNIPKVGCLVSMKTTSCPQHAANYNSFEEILAEERQGFIGPGIDDCATGVDDLQSVYDGVPLNGTERRKRKIVSCREYYVYKLQDCPNDKSYILRFGRLFQ
ncbi:hypothetical protein LIER_28078 [Lithospermum erythrorhizon]|uniref:Uncharacterized protein n=1 Tax=Lithospermum erythrorhizon TaxID=34254 RepID=A0AAV3RKE3_LITER